MTSRISRAAYPVHALDGFAPENLRKEEFARHAASLSHVAFYRSQPRPLSETDSKQRGDERIYPRFRGAPLLNVSRYKFFLSTPLPSAIYFARDTRENHFFPLLKHSAGMNGVRSFETAGFQGTKP